MSPPANLSGNFIYCSCLTFCTSYKHERDRTLGDRLDSDQFIGGNGPSQFVCLPRRDEFHLKGMEVNSMVKGAIESNNFQLVCLSNLSKESLFFDKKHLNKFSSVRMMANNFGECFAKSFSNWMIKKATIVQQRHLPFVRTPFDPSQKIPTRFQESFQSGNRQNLLTPQSVYQQPLSYAKVVSPQEKPQNSVSSLLITMLCQKC